MRIVLYAIFVLAFAYHAFRPYTLFYVQQHYTLLQTHRMDTIAAIIWCTAALVKNISDVMPIGCCSLMHKRPYIVVAAFVLVISFGVMSTSSSHAAVITYFLGVAAYVVISVLYTSTWLAMFRDYTYPMQIRKTIMALSGIIVFYTLLFSPELIAFTTLVLFTILFLAIAFNQSSVPHDEYTPPMTSTTESLLEPSDSQREDLSKSTPVMHLFQLVLFAAMLLPNLVTDPDVSGPILAISAIPVAISAIVMYHDTDSNNFIYISLAIFFVVSEAVVVSIPAADTTFYTMSCVYSGPQIDPAIYMFTDAAILVVLPIVAVYYNRLFHYFTYRSVVQIAYFILLIAKCFDITIAARTYTSITLVYVTSNVICKPIAYSILAVTYASIVGKTLFKTHSITSIIALLSCRFFGQAIAATLGLNLLTLFSVSGSVLGGCNFTQYAPMLVFASIPGILFVIAIAFATIPNIQIKHL